MLPFVSELSKSIFGVATTNDVNILAQHVNQLTKNNNKVAKVLERYGGDFSSFVSHIDDRLSNAIKGMKEEAITINRMITEIKHVESELTSISTIFTGYLMRHLNDAFLLETFMTNLRASLSSCDSTNQTVTRLHPITWHYYNISFQKILWEIFWQIRHSNR